MNFAWGFLFLFTVFFAPVAWLLGEVWRRRRRKARLAAAPPNLRKLVEAVELAAKDNPHLAGLADALLEPGQARVGFMSAADAVAALDDDEETVGTDS